MGDRNGKRKAKADKAIAMKKAIYFLLFVLTALLLQAQNNPYAQFGDSTAVLHIEPYMEHTNKNEHGVAKIVMTPGRINYIDSAGLIVYSREVKTWDVNRWLSVDPLAKEYAEWGPYAAMGDNPVQKIDPDGRKFYNFNEAGDYMGVSHDNWFHNLFFKQGRVVDNNGNVSRQFRFADRKNDTRQIEEGLITKLVIVSHSEIKKMVAWSGAFEDQNRTKYNPIENRWDYALDEGEGGGNMDFSYTHIPRLYPEASSDPLLWPSSLLFLPPQLPARGEHAHNQMNFGNYMYALAGQALGLSLIELSGGGHWNSLVHPQSNGYDPQLDSVDDQFSIREGFNYGLYHDFDKMSFKVEPGTPEITPINDHQ